jgi:hypothetical protein
MWLIVTRSTPAAPLLRRTRFHASCRTSPLHIWPYNAWKRLPGARLAAAQSCLCSCRTLSPQSPASGSLGPVLPAIPSRLPALSMTTAGTLPSSRVMPHGLRRFGLRLTVRYYDPLGLPLRTLDFALGLYERACPDKGRADGPLVFRSCPCTRAAPHTPPQSPARFGSRPVMLPSP